MRGNSMNKEIQSVQKRADQLMGDYPEKRRDLSLKLETAEAELRQAKARQDAAENMESYEAAEKEVKKAELEAKFARDGIRKLDLTPRMTDEEYDKLVNSVDTEIRKAVDDYRQKAAGLMAELKEAHVKLLTLAREADDALTDLDEAARVLQSRHRNRVQKYLGMPDVVREDPNEWKNYAVRYMNGSLANLATLETPTAKKKLTDPYDDALFTAWTAVARAYPHETF